MGRGRVMPCAAWRAPVAMSSDHIIVVSISPTLGTSTQARDGINIVPLSRERRIHPLRFTTFPSARLAGCSGLLAGVPPLWPIERQLDLNAILAGQLDERRRKMIRGPGPLSTIVNAEIKGHSAAALIAS